MRRTIIKRVAYADMLTDASAALQRCVNGMDTITSYQIGSDVVNGMVDVCITVKVMEFDPQEIYHVADAVIKNKDAQNRLPIYVAIINDATVVFKYDSKEDIIHDIPVRITGRDSGGEYQAIVVDTPYTHFIFTRDMDAYSVYRPEEQVMRIEAKKFENEDVIKRSLSLFADTRAMKIVDGSPSKVQPGAITRIDYRELESLDGFGYLITAPKYRNSGKCYVVPVAVTYSQKDLQKIVQVLLHDELHTLHPKVKGGAP